MATENQKLKQVFTDMLRQVSEEVTEFVEIPGKGGDVEMVIRSKAEALARFVWKQALGYEELDDSGEKVKHAPDKWAMSLLFDRLEGKVVAIPVAGRTERSIADRVSEQGRKALNNLADK
jgi:hypothetical protein